MSNLQDPSDDEPDELGEPDEPKASVEGEEHISFVQRLESHFGEAVDPEIDLHEGEHAEEESSQLARDRTDGESSSSSRALVRKLAESIQLGSRFKVKRELARGGMGIIFRVWDQDLRRNLAMKVMHSNSSVQATQRPEDCNQEKLGRFLEEAQITGQLDHPGIVPVHDLGIDTKGRCYFTMRLVRGRELKEVLDLMRENKENWTRTKVLSLILKVCESMAFAHSKGVVHRDLKPQNIMVGRFGEVYVMDWGLARVLGRRDSHDLRLKPEVDEPSALSLVRTVRKDDSEANPDSSLVTMDGDVVGTPSFMAVEQAQGKLEEVGVRSDVYSLGAILYYMLTGRSPYVTPGERASPHTVLNRVLQGPPEPVSTYAKDQPAELVAICEKAMHRDAAERYDSMLAVAEDIQAYLEDRVVGAYEGGSFAEARKWISRNRGIALATAALILLSLGSAIGFAVMKENRISSLEAKELVIQKSIDEAQASEKKAAEERNNAMTQARLAKESQAKAEASEAEAMRNAEQASRAGYQAKILAADFSLRLNDVVKSRNQLKSSSNQFRDWEHSHLDLRTRNAMVNIDSLRKNVARSGSAGSFLRHRGPIDQVAFGPGQEHLALLTREGWLRFMKPMSGAEALGEDLQLEHPSPILWASGLVPDMSFNAAADRVALVGFDNLVHVFDVAGRSLLQELPLEGDPGHTGRVSEAAYSLADGRLMTGSDTGEVILWGVDGSMHVRTSREGLAVTSLAWSPDGGHWAAGFSDGVVLVWEALLPQIPIHRLVGHTSAVSSVAFSADGAQIISAGEDGKLNTWSRRQGRLEASYTNLRKALIAMDYDPHSGRVVTGSSDRTLRIWDLETGESRVLLGHEAEVRAVSFSEDGRFIVSSDAEGAVKTWDAHADAALTDLAPMDSGVSAVAFGPKGRLMASADERGELILWDAQAGLPRARLRGHGPGQRITALAFDRAGKHLFSASEDKTVRRWNTTTGRQSASYRHEEAVTGLGISEDDAKQLFTTSGKSIYTFDIETRTEIRRFVASPLKITGMRLHPDGKLIGCTNSTSLMIWDVTGSREPRRFDLLGSRGQLAFAPNGRRVVSSSRKGELRGWNLQSEGLDELPIEASLGVNVLAYHPKGRRYASGSRDGSVRIWDASTGEVLLTLFWPDEEVKAMAFDSDGRRLMAGSASGRLRIWETDLAGLRRQRSFDEGQRRAAMQPVVDQLFNQHFYVSDVLGALESLPGLDDEDRLCATLLANLRGDDPGFHSAGSLAIALDAKHPAEAYDQARRQAEAALEMSVAPHQPALLLALGVACYRAQDFIQAGVHLEQARRRLQELEAQEDALEAALDTEQLLILTLFQSLTSQQRGRQEEAMRLFDEASVALQGADLASLSRQLRDLWNEVGEQVADV